MQFSKVRPIIVGGLALFCMFFGAGNVIFPLILGGASSAHPILAVFGLTISAVIFPLIGLLGIMLFDGNQSKFFGRVGKWGGWFLYFFCQIVLGIIGVAPRNLTVMFGSLSSYIPGVSIVLFSLICVVLMFALLVKPGKLVGLLGSILTPLLLLFLAILVVMGLVGHPELIATQLTGSGGFAMGFIEGYNTLDLLAAPLFGPLVISYFRSRSSDQAGASRKSMLRSFLWASLIAAGLLLVVYAGLTVLASYYVPYLPPGIGKAQLLHAVATLVFGPTGAFVASIVVVLACFTTALSLAAIFAEYLRKDLFKGRIGATLSLALTVLGIGVMATLGFEGIMAVLIPVLLVSYPVFIVLSLLNIGHKTLAFQPVKIPLAVTLGASALFLLV